MRYIFLGLFIGSILVVLLWLFIQVNKGEEIENHHGAISTFGECVRGGFEVIEGIPRKCTTPNGQEFLEQKEKKPVGI